MTELALRARSFGTNLGRIAWRKQRVWLVSAVIVALIALVDRQQAGATLAFTAQNLINTAPFLVLSIAIAAWAAATGADSLIARAFTGSPVTMIVLAALAGGLSPFCSCGVIPLIAALLAMGVPLSAVMAFWLASPVMDPSMFVLTAGVLGMDFAIAKTITAVALGLLGGFTVHALAQTGMLDNVLREGVGNGGCGGAKVRTQKPVVWRFWTEPARREKFGKEALSITLFLAKWLTLAFVLESIMLAIVPPELVAETVGDGSFLSVFIAMIVGVPAYLNGYAALPVVGGLVEQGMAPGAALTFLVGGGVTSIPAALAVFALVRWSVFALYIVLALVGSLAAGLIFQAVMV